MAWYSATATMVAVMVLLLVFFVVVRASSSCPMNHHHPPSTRCLGHCPVDDPKDRKRWDRLGLGYNCRRTEWHTVPHLASNPLEYPKKPSKVHCSERRWFPSRTIDVVVVEMVVRKHRHHRHPHRHEDWCCGRCRGFGHR